MTETRTNNTLSLQPKTLFFRQLLTTLPLLCLLFSELVFSQQKALYPYPPGLVFKEGDRELSCEALEDELIQLQPLTYSYKPGFYDDPAHGVAIWGGLFWTPALIYLPYSGMAEYYDRKRIDQANDRIAVLRQLKAYRHCYQR
jgi:hypothetical protein